MAIKRTHLTLLSSTVFLFACLPRDYMGLTELYKAKSAFYVHVVLFSLLLKIGQNSKEYLFVHSEIIQVEEIVFRILANGMSR